MQLIAVLCTNMKQDIEPAVHKQCAVGCRKWLEGRARCLWRLMTTPTPLLARAQSEKRSWSS